MQEAGCEDTGGGRQKSRVRIPWGMLVARFVRGGQFGYSHPVSLSGEDSCFVDS